MTLPELLARLPKRFRWTLHNLGARRASDAVHDRTVPSRSSEPRG